MKLQSANNVCSVWLATSVVMETASLDVRSRCVQNTFFFCFADFHNSSFHASFRQGKFGVVLKLCTSLLVIVVVVFVSVHRSPKIWCTGKSWQIWAKRMFLNGWHFFSRRNDAGKSRFSPFCFALVSKFCRFVFERFWWNFLRMNFSLYGVFVWAL